MKIKILYFAAIREKVGKGSEELEATEGETLNDIMGKLKSRYPIIADMNESLLVAVNREYSKRETVLKNGDEVALIPPVSGG